MRPMRLGLIAAVLARAALCGLAEAQVADVEVMELVEAQKRALDAQAQQIEMLERRVRELEARAEAPPTVAIPASYDATAVENDQVERASGSGTTGARDFAVGRFPDDAVVRVGSFDGAITVPGTELSIRLGGFAQADTIIDSGSMGSPYAFVARTILQGSGDRGVETRLTARRTRFNLDVRGPSELGAFRVFFEGDFDGEGGEEYLANGSSFRLRHAFGQLGSLYFGQYWTTFTDLNAYPEVLDTASPAGRVGARQTGIRYVGQVSPDIRFVVGVENPQADIRGTGIIAIDRAPDLVANVSVERPWGHFQISGSGRYLAAETPLGSRDTMGWGINATGRVTTAVGDPRNNIVFGAMAGEGIGRYFMEFAGTGSDAAVDPVSGQLEALRAYGGYFGSQIWWAERLRSTFTVGGAVIDDGGMLSVGAVDRVTTASINLLWNPIEPVTMGAELQWGESENVDGSVASASRLQITARHQF